MSVPETDVVKITRLTGRDAFKADPERYAPQYGGFCAYGVAVGKKFDIDPSSWRMVAPRSLSVARIPSSAAFGKRCATLPTVNLGTL